MGADLLQLKNITKYFSGLRALNKIDLSVKEGTITALIGPNGAGKTTLINIITGVYNPSEGSVLFSEKKIDRLQTHEIAKSGLVRTFQITKLFRGMSVLENVMVGAHSWAKAANFFPTLLNQKCVRCEEIQIYDFAMEMLKLVNLEKQAREPAASLPQGQQRLLELARSMAARPKLVLLDEPAAGLNPHEEDMLREALRSIIRKGTTIFLVEHHMRLVMNVSDWVHVINVGSKIAEGTPREIGKNPSVVKAYLGKEY